MKCRKKLFEKTVFSDTALLLQKCDVSYTATRVNFRPYSKKPAMEKKSEKMTSGLFRITAGFYETKLPVEKVFAERKAKNSVSRQMVALVVEY